MIPFVIQLIIIFRTIFHSFIMKTENNYWINIKVLSLVIVSGLITCIFEPQGVFGAINWYCIWWFFLKFSTPIIYIQKNKRTATIFVKKLCQTRQAVVCFSSCSQN